MNSHNRIPPVPLQTLIRVAILIALNVLLMNYLGIHTQFFKIGFSFIPVALCAMLYGWKGGLVCGGVGDLLNCFLGPFGWYPPLTLSACLSGTLYGFLKGRSDHLLAITSICCISQLVISLGLNTWFLSMLYTTPYWELLLTRVPQALVMLPVQIVALRAIGTKRLIATLAGSAA